MEVLAIERERHYQFYDVRDERWSNEGHDIEPQLMTKLAYSKQGDWIGKSKDAYRLVHRFGIEQFEKTEEDHCVCSIGYASADQKWYGWSHRAICGFTIGSTCKKGDCHYTPTSFDEIQQDCHLRRSYWTEKSGWTKGNTCTARDRTPQVAIDPAKLPDADPSNIDVANPLEEDGPCTEKLCVYETGKGEWVAKTMEDAKQMAIDFAKSVS